MTHISTDSAWLNPATRDEKNDFVTFFPYIGYFRTKASTYVA